MTTTVWLSLLPALLLLNYYWTTTKMITKKKKKKKKKRRRRRKRKMLDAVDDGMVALVRLAAAAAGSANDGDCGRCVGDDVAAAMERVDGQSVAVAAVVVAVANAAVGRCGPWLP